MLAKRRLSKSADEANAKDLSKAKKSKIGGRKRTTSVQEGQVDDDTIFVQLLKSAGMILKHGNQPNKLSLDQAVFQKKLCQALRKHPRYPN
ncbi:Fanconi anemia group D2 protein-like, partial [Rhincodon typus]|uniref:Fanconi anemia group D2 protein-like n=1 Tax=Rhincodon typus TaxID=259920 RepID=UPI00202FC2D1